MNWAALQGVPRAYLAVQARRGDPFAQLLAGPKRALDPYPLMAEIGSRGRVFRTRYMTVTTDYEICRNILRDNTFGVAVPQDFAPAGMDWVLRAVDLDLANPVEPPAMVIVDPPDHTRYRKLVAQTFTPRAIAKLGDRIEAVTEDLLTSMESAHTADLIADFAARLPVAIIAEILGVPPESHSQLVDWGDSGAALLDNAMSWKAFRSAIAGLTEVNAFLSDHIERLRTDPGDDILSQITINGGLTDRELLATALLLLGAGFETTVNLIGNGIVALLGNLAQLERLRANPDLWPGAIEEILRFNSPVQMTARIAHTDTEVAGERFGKGEIVVLLTGGANRDPKVFENPNTFDITRPNAREHLSFGNGIHACLGASLARMEGATALRALFERFPDLALDGSPTQRGLVTLRGFARLPARLAPREHFVAVHSRR